MGENAATENNQNHHHHHRQVGDVSIEMLPQSVPRCIDDDGHLKRTGTLWTASAHITTAMVGPIVLSLAWNIAQLGWIAGPAAMLLFSFVSYYTSCLLSDCYRTGSPVSGERNYTYVDTVHSILGGVKVKACAFIQYMILFGMAINITVGASISMMLFVGFEAHNIFSSNVRPRVAGKFSLRTRSSSSSIQGQILIQ